MAWEGRGRRSCDRVIGTTRQHCHSSGRSLRPTSPAVGQVANAVAPLPTRRWCRRGVKQQARRRLVLSVQAVGVGAVPVRALALVSAVVDHIGGGAAAAAPRRPQRGATMINLRHGLLLALHGYLDTEGRKLHCRKTRYLSSAATSLARSPCGTSASSSALGSCSSATLPSSVLCEKSQKITPTYRAFECRLFWPFRRRRRPTSSASFRTHSCVLFTASESQLCPRISNLLAASALSGRSFGGCACEGFITIINFFRRRYSQVGWRRGRRWFICAKEKEKHRAADGAARPHFRLRPLHRRE